MKLSDALPERVRAHRAVEVLERSLERGRLGHAILLHGDDPEALEAIASAVAAQLLGAPGDPAEHPDCFSLAPSGKSRVIAIGKREGGSEFPPNTMRRFLADLSKSASQGRHKAGIVHEADRMNSSSFNAFLKTLEEPARDTTLFLVTARPHALPATIRSRCLDFRVPAAAQREDDPAWETWKRDYEAWLRTLAGGVRSKATVAEVTMTAYGLNHRFQRLLQAKTQEAWKSRKAELAADLSDEQKDAAERGLSRGYRKQRYAEIERATADFARAIEAERPGDLPVQALHRAVDALEHAAGLLELNFQDNAALEVFLLRSMRIWTRAAPAAESNAAAS